MSPARTRTMLSALFADQQPSQTFCKIPIRPLAKTPRQKVRGSAAPRESCIAPVSWNDANWRRMVNNKFFLREINAHRCMRSNLSRGSASAMRMLRLVLWENHPRLRHRLHRHTCARSYEQISYHLRLERFCLCIWPVPLLLGSFEPVASVDCNGLETTRYAQ